MKRIAFTLVSFVFVFIACSTDDKTDTANDLEDLKNLSEKVETVWNEGDIEGFLALIDDEALFKGPDKPSIVGIEKLSDFYKGFFSALNFNVEIISEEIYVFGDYAYSLETWRGSMSPKDGSTPIFFDNTDLAIYKRQADNTWKVWRTMYNTNSPPIE